MQPIIEARGVSRVYGRAGAGVFDIDLAVAEGEFVVLKGASGSGKSTLLALLAGLDRPTSGSLLVAGHLLSGPGDLTDFRRKAVGMVFQTFNLLPTLTVLENVCLPALLAGQPYSPVRRKGLELLGRLGMEPRTGHLPSELSGGEQQRAAIARALINNPRLVLADEPTGNLDSRNGQAVVELLAEIGRERTVVFATHGDLADGCATRHIRLRDGRIVSDAQEGAGCRPGGVAP